MSTNSTIAVEGTDSKVSMVYCHWDGYIEHNGKILKESYSSVRRLSKLINGGALSLLGNEINPSSSTHTFDNPEEDVCVFYRRDRNETDLMDKKVYNSFEEYTKSTYFHEFNYIFRDGKWFVYKLEYGKSAVVFEEF
jgi:hypothetical protein